MQDARCRGQDFEFRIAKCEFKNKETGVRIQNSGVRFHEFPNFLIPYFSNSLINYLNLAIVPPLATVVRPVGFFFLPKCTILL
jgi:hypothetical protein